MRRTPGVESKLRCRVLRHYPGGCRRGACSAKACVEDVSCSGISEGATDCVARLGARGWCGRSAEPGAPGQHLWLEGTERCGLLRVVSPGPDGLLAGRQGAARVGGPVEAWSRGLGDGHGICAGPFRGNPSAEIERIRGLGGRLELVRRSLRGAVDQCRR
ncbi:hypothetical protein NDU88_001109 [Pleurodeles waltl]|uniref:Uncharacterized protein n=1 Tax=Pleurodeles waltl TaxID=8319 RepID=A0AAV7MJN2_PLEWA|nr:hypothetical protein NDU88_001109 [Pleurodeles waltl]